MTEKTADTSVDYSKTLYLPQTDFPMRAGLPDKEPKILERWTSENLYGALREKAKGRPKFVLHDGPPYANGHLHIGHALNKILKDVITRQKQMEGFDSNYVPGWDCHGLPIEWKIEEKYRAAGKNKDEVPKVEFRAECRAFAEHWVGVQSAEFQRLGVIGDFERPYLTMDYEAEAVIAGEIQKFALNGQLYRGSKPVMWSVVEKTALAEAEVEYQDYTSDTIFVKFPVVDGDLVGASVVIWTTTPWTIPGNRAVSFSNRIAYGLYEVTASPEGNWASVGDKLVLADKLAEEVMKAAKVEDFTRLRDVTAAELLALTLAHPLADLGYGFQVPLLDGDHVTDDSGTGFVHTAPGHGREDFEIWMANARALDLRGIDTAIPFTVDDGGFLTEDAPGFVGRTVITSDGDKGDANKAVIDALVAAGALLARGRLKHQYPHSWRSKKPVIFRNTPQWFIHMDRDFVGAGKNEPDTLRTRALKAIAETTFYPPAGQNRLNGMIANRPDWVVSRQRAWGVPIAVFRNAETGQLAPGPTFAKSEELRARIFTAFVSEGADAWYEEGAKERFLGGLVEDLDQWDQVQDILDVWFDSGSTHAFCLRRRPDLKWPADMYLEGSDQHRGWFHSSLLESCGTNGRAPYDSVLTHGFVMAEDGRKMSKSLGNQVFPQDVIKQSGADILRLWVMTSDYADDLRIGKEILQTNVESYRKLRNTLRWMLGTLTHHEPELDPEFAELPELERLMLHRLREVGDVVEAGYAAYDFKKVVGAILNFMVIDLSAFYFDVRKDALYCEARSSVKRRAALAVVDQLFGTIVKWLAPMLPFTTEEAWGHRFPGAGSIHLELFPVLPDLWRDEALAAKWAKVREVRRVVTGALEIERAAKRIGSSLEAAPIVHVSDADLAAALDGVDLAEVAITSSISVVATPAPEGAFTLPDVAGVAVVPVKLTGKRCARSWRIVADVGSDPELPDLSARDAAAYREWLAGQAEKAPA
ncbi:isoleucine--tRNA ligase [Pinisolibacter aquiterrae]|uniref:isoleucine--tRNA ligase n=1 Tax=Pinisolibacter aquiterrae TaxID=2815579 RepID=UPI001C3CD34A|nr:isoleucine--tRNA ligase [Pinisolibacter aquiterrae]MBV5266650.1 isoleucine--tRNA ligase [Pinisolibacter aquiterrae]MCC8235038.1 isoleucine--tRNA ligase [Pinisolibacter aquiterrae]